MDLFLLNTGSNFHVREVARRTRLNLNSVRLELNNLESAGILQSRREGSLKLYSVNSQNPIYEELKSILLKTTGIGEEVRIQLAGLGMIKTAFIYGSFSEDNERPRSDIDIFIVGEIDQRKASSIFAQLEKKLAREINYVIFSPEEFSERKAKKDPFVSNVLKQKKIMLVNN